MNADKRRFNATVFQKKFTLPSNGDPVGRLRITVRSLLSGGALEAQTQATTNVYFIGIPRSSAAVGNSRLEEQ